MKYFKLLFISLCLSVPVSGLTLKSEDFHSKPLNRCQQVIETGELQTALDFCFRQLVLIKSTESVAEINQIKSLDGLYLLLKLADISHSLGLAEKETQYLAYAFQHPQFSTQPKANYEWQRRTGQKYYFAKNIELASKHLYQGLKIATEQNSPLMLAKSYNDVGLIESQQGNFRQSLLHYQKSLAIKLKEGDQYATGTTLNNIGLIYRKLENYAQSVDYYEQALKSFLAYTQQTNFDQRVFTNINHLYEDLAVTYGQLKDSEKEKYYQQKVQASMKSKNSSREQTRALVNIAALYIDDEKLALAKPLLENAELLQKQAQFDLRLEIDHQWARFYQLSDNPDRAIFYANSGVIIAEKKANLQVLSELYQTLAKSYRGRDIETAYHYQTLYAETREKFLAQKFNAEMKSIQIQIEKQQVEHQLMLQQVENSQNQIKIQQLTTSSLIVIIMLLLCIGFIIFYLLKKQKEKQTLLQSIKYHQQQLILLDDKYQNLNKILSENESEYFPVSADKKENTTTEAPTPPAPLQQVRQNLRQILVNTMLNAVSIWESHTGENRVELAEKSKLWTVSIDNGTLRTRSLDKYLTLDKIPVNPKWRNVAGTCHFILSDVSLAPKKRACLNQDLDILMEAVKNFSLSANG